MVGSSGNRKVARAARTSSGRRRNASAPVGFYSTLVIICILGVALVFFSRKDNVDASNPGSTPPLAPVVDSSGNLSRAGDKWYEAYGVYICDKYVANISSTNNPYGISTDNDGIIHISPFQKKYAGHNSTLGLFGKAVDLKVDRTSVQVPGDPKKYDSGEKCGDKSGKFVVKEWSDAKNKDSGKEIKSDPKRLLLKDNAAVAIAFIPDNMKWEDIPLPDSAAHLDEAKAKDAAAGGASGNPATTDTTAPAATTETTAPTGTTTPTTAAP